MTWRSGMLAGLVLLAGCDTRPEAVVKGEMRMHILERCQNGQYAIPEGVGYLAHSYYCGCLRDRLTEGKTRSELIAMEKNAALYMEPGENIIRQCTDRSIAQGEEERRRLDRYIKTGDMGR